MKSMTKNRVVRALAPTWRSARAVIALAMAGALSAACDVHGISAPGTLQSISVSPNATLVAGTTQQMVAVGYDADGRVTNITPQWTVANSGGVIASSGVFTAGNMPGLYANTVVATVGNVSGRASITVVPGALATITVVPTPVTLAVTAKQQFTAVGKDASGNIVAFSPTWAVVASGGTIDQGGMFTAGGTPGTFTNTVQASYNSIKGFATVNVTAGPLATLTVTPTPASLAVGQSQQFTAVGKDASGNVVAMTPVWTVGAGGTINATGLFVAGGTLGTFANTVTATSGTASGTATVTVTAGPVTTITISPNPATMAVGATTQLTAVGTDAGGNVVPITPVWDLMTASNGASVSQTGMYTAGTVAGTFPNKVRATSGGVSGFGTIIVTSAVLTSITVSPNPVFMQTGGTQQFTAVGRDANNNVFIITPTWSVVNGGGAINANSGLFTAGLTAGTFANTVVATSGTVSGTATVNVSAALTSVVVTPNPVSMVTGGTQQFSATGLDAGGNPFAISPVWSVVSGGGTISSSGLFTAGTVAGTYPNTVKATSGSFSGTATVTVTASIPAGINLLGAAAPNGIMAGLSVSCAGLGVINADISVSPGSTLSGFGPCVYTGVAHLGDPTAAAAQLALTTAYNTLMGQPCPAANNFGTVDYAGKTLPAGVYCSGSTIGVTGTLTLDGGGDPNATFVFQAGSSLTGAANILLINSADAKNVYWVNGASATLNASNWKGNIIALADISLKVNTNLLGRALARNGSVTLDATSNVITLP